MKFYLKYISNKNIWNSEHFKEDIQLDTDDVSDVLDLKKKYALENDNIENFTVIYEDKLLDDNINISDLEEDITLILVNNSDVIIPNKKKKADIKYSNLLNSFIDSLNMTSSDNSVDTVNFNNISNIDIEAFISNFQNLYTGTNYTTNSQIIDNETNDSDDSEFLENVTNENNINDNTENNINDNTENSNLLLETNENLSTNNGSITNFINNISNSIYSEANRDKYKDELNQLEKMGFIDISKNIESLEITNGNVEQAVNILLSNF